MTINPNDNAREASPGVWIFQGRSVIVLVCGAMAFVALFRVMAAWDVDFIVNLFISASPLLLASGAVYALRGKPRSYAGDLILLYIYKGKVKAFMNGWMERAPVLWLDGGVVRHPKEF